MEYKALYTVKEVSEILMVGINTVYDLIHAKELPAMKLGQYKIRGTDLEKFINDYPNTEL
jgi:excisionase family DNA binding protein